MKDEIFCLEVSYLQDMKHACCCEPAPASVTHGDATQRAGAAVVEGTKLGPQPVGKAPALTTVQQDAEHQRHIGLSFGLDNGIVRVKDALAKGSEGP